MNFPSHKYFSKLYTAVLVFVLVILSGTFGYMAIEHFTFLEALYMTVITLSTVGFAEVHPLDSAGRIFTILLIFINLGVFAYFIGLISTYFFDGEFIREFKLYKMKNAIAELEHHVIICGFGRNGHEAARIFHQSGKKFVVIEKTPGRHLELPFPVPYYLVDDATRDEAFTEAGIKKASAVIATLPDDADNVFVVLTARELNPRLKIISRASNDSSMKKLKTAGADGVIMPDKIGGVHMASMVISPDIKEFVDIIATQNNDEFTVAEIEAGKTINLDELDCWRRTGATLLGIKTANEEYQLNPPPKTIIRTGHELIVMGSKEQLNKLRELLK
jgi:voltage-gated potassium channel